MLLLFILSIVINVFAISFFVIAMFGVSDIVIYASLIVIIVVLLFDIFALIFGFIKSRLTRILPRVLIIMSILEILLFLFIIGVWLKIFIAAGQFPWY